MITQNMFSKDYFAYYNVFFVFFKTLHLFQKEKDILFLRGKIVGKINTFIFLGTMQR